MLEEEVFWIRMYSKASSIILELKLFKFEENLVNVCRGAQMDGLSSALFVREFGKPAINYLSLVSS